MGEQSILFVCIFAVIVLAIWGMMQLIFGQAGVKVRQRLTESAKAPTAAETAVRPQAPKLKQILQGLGQAAAKPFMSDSREKQSSLRKNLAFAGIYSQSAIRVVTGAKVICMFAGLAGGYAVGVMSGYDMLGLSVGGLIGYVGPTLWLKLRIKKQRKSLEHGLPDALDLMVVCVEAGLATDAAMQRVGQELALVHPPLSRELEIAHMETRIGLARSESLRNLGQRTGSQPLQALASMMIQADRFGTSIGTALRIHAESLRLTRQYKAEEQAAKASVKLSFPLVLFIFPSTFIVLAGPTVVKLLDSPLFK